MLNYFRQFHKFSMLIFLLAFTVPLFLSMAGTDTVSASGALQQQKPEISPFLYPPYPGTVIENAIFDHKTPVNALELRDGVIVAFTGDEASGNVSVGEYWNDDLGFLLSYDQHEGIDYNANYVPIFAAADSYQVIAAGWSNPGNHSSGLGLHVGLLHANGYRTYYGHLSAIGVSACSTGCAPITHGDIIGISGNTGDSGGPHLHFEVRNPIPNPITGEYKTRIDPYGWTGAGIDPWEDAWRANPNESLWVDYPEINNSDSVLYATNEDDPLTFPLFPGSSNSVLVDDYGRLLAQNGQVSPGSSPNFTAGNCWTVPAEDPLITNIDPLYIAEDQYKLLSLTTATECTANWSLPADQQTGNYAIYVHIPGTYNSLVNSVVYRVYAGGEEVAKVLVNQQEIESYLESQASSEDLTVNSAWIYVGAYYFIQGEDNSIRVSNVPEESMQSGTVVLADAVKFVPTTTGNTPTPTLTPTPPPSTQTVRVSINKGSDDAGTNPTPCVSNATDNEVYLGACFNGDDIKSGFRFENIQIPRGANIESAYIRFTADGTYTVPVQVQVYGENSGNPLTYSASNPPAIRSTTSESNSVSWDITDTWVLGESRSTPDISSVIQEIVNGAGWSSGRPISIIVKNAGSSNVRRVIAYERASFDPQLEPAELEITYSLDGIPPPTSTPVTSTPTPVPTNTPTPIPPTPAPLPECSSCVLIRLLQILGGGCVEPTVSASRFAVQSNAESISEQTPEFDINVFYSVRDELLNQTPQGQHYIDLYNMYTPEIAKTIATHPQLIDEAVNVLQRWEPHLRALIDGNGDSAVITSEDVQSAQSFLDQLKSFSSPELQTVIENEQLSRPLEQMIDMTMDDAWTYLNGYQLEWLNPVSKSNPYETKSGSVVPIQFRLTDTQGNFVLDESLRLELVDSNGNVVIGPITLGNNPANGIVIQNQKYHYNLETKGLKEGLYTLKVYYNAVNPNEPFTWAIKIKGKK